MNQNYCLAKEVLQQLIEIGVQEFCISPGNRNSALFDVLFNAPQFKKYYWPEERSSAFFALGRARESKKPVAVITTSGTAAGELLPAVMESYYLGVPLILLTADRPKNLRGTGAPQAAEQVGIFGVYTPCFFDICFGDSVDLSGWDMASPLHINVCFEDPLRKGKGFLEQEVVFSAPAMHRTKNRVPDFEKSYRYLDAFVKQSGHLLVIASTLKEEAKEDVVRFLLALNAPVVLEGVSGLREDPRLSHLKVHFGDKLLEHAGKGGYPIDRILRIGGVPTLTLWRDLEEAEEIKVCSINDANFSGLALSEIICAPLDVFFKGYCPSKTFSASAFEKWIKKDRARLQGLRSLFLEEPRAEQSLIHEFSKKLPVDAHVYLGNSLPIREWDLSADCEHKKLLVTASRGLNGIDGQISTFAGLSKKGRDNFALIGDLTTLYDMAAPWIFSQMESTAFHVVVVNNGGGQIFSRMFPYKQFQNPHMLCFKPLAEFWSLNYERWERVPESIASPKNRLIEMTPDNDSSARFHQKLQDILC